MTEIAGLGNRIRFLICYSNGNHPILLNTKNFKLFFKNN